jgi:hypothetical protein
MPHSIAFIALFIASATAILTVVNPAQAFSVKFTKIADPASTYPDNSMLGVVADAAQTDTLSAFTTGDTVYVKRNGQTIPIVSPDKLKPFGYTKFFSYRGLSASGDRVAVGTFGQSANDPQETGLYVWRNGTLKEVAKNGSKALNSGSTVDSISNVSISGNNVAFTDQRRSPRVRSLYVSLNGKLYLVQGAGARGFGPMLDGRGTGVSAVTIGPNSLKGNSINFRADFFGAPSAVYRADLTP